jgi:hypothetical protein
LEMYVQDAPASHSIRTTPSSKAGIRSEGRGSESCTVRGIP